MSLISRARQRKREEKIKAREKQLAFQTGLYFSRSVTDSEKGFPFLKYIVNALILFGTVYGSAGCVISAFSLEINERPLIISCAAAAVLFSFMYVSFKTKVAAYLLFLFGVIYGGLKYFVIVNSGMSAIINNILKEIDRVSDLPFLREFTTFYEDEYTAMSVTVCVFAVSMMLFINIFVSEKMSPVMVFLLSFPIAQSGMYFGLTPAKAPMVCLASGWVLVAAVRFTNAYNGLNDKSKVSSKVKKHRHSYTFVADPKNVASIAVIWLVFILGVSAFTFYAVPTENFSVPFLAPTVKQSTERVVKNFLSYGFSSLFSAERLSDSPGKLSNTKSISFDGRADLKITLVDYGADRIYLRNFAGENYSCTSLQWNGAAGENSRERFCFTANELENDYEGERLVSDTRHIMAVRLLDPNLKGNPLNVPYFSAPGDDFSFNTSAEITLDAQSGLREDETLYYTFFTLDNEAENYSALSSFLNEEEKATLEEIRAAAFENALTVPERNVEAIAAFCEKYGIEKGDKDALEKITGAFEQDFEYTLKPGKIPVGEDYVNYFLAGNKKGYCQHFASAAVLIMRYLGFPARYAEGYVINRNMILDGTKSENGRVEKWIKGDGDYGEDVLTVSVPDSCRHAWIEVFTEGLGWAPEEVTTAQQSESSAQRPGIISLIIGSITAVQSASADNTLPSLDREQVKETGTRLANLARAALVLLAAAYFIRMAVTVIKRRLGYKTESGRKNTLARYCNLVQIAEYAYGGAVKTLSYRDFAALLAEKGILTAEEASELAEETERAIFGGEESEQLYESVQVRFGVCKKKLAAALPLPKKAGYYLIKILW